MTVRLALAIAAAATALSVAAAAQRAGAFSESRDHPAIAYTDGIAANVVSKLIADLRSGEKKRE